MSFGKIGVAFLMVVIAVTAAPVLVAPLILHAQTRVAVQSYSATVINRTKGEIYFKIVGGKGKTFIEGTLQPNFKSTQAASYGDKVVCIWDKEGSLLAAWRLTVVGNFTITVRDLKYADFTEPAAGVVDMEMPQAGSAAPSPSVERKPN